MGVKSVNEIKDWIQVLLNGSNDFILVDQSSVNDQECSDNTKTIIIQNENCIVRDIPIANTSLSAKAKNSLKRGKICTVSGLLGKTEADLLKIRQIGPKTIIEILDFTINRIIK